MVTQYDNFVDQLVCLLVAGRAARWAGLRLRSADTSIFQDVSGFPQLPGVSTVLLIWWDHTPISLDEFADELDADLTILRTSPVFYRMPTFGGRRHLTVFGAAPVAIIGYGYGSDLAMALHALFRRVEVRAFPETTLELLHS